MDFQRRRNAYPYLRIEQLTELKGGIDGVPTGFVDLDNLLTGLHGGELVIDYTVEVDHSLMGEHHFEMVVSTQPAQV